MSLVGVWGCGELETPSEPPDAKLFQMMTSEPADAKLFQIMTSEPADAKLFKMKTSEPVQQYSTSGPLDV